MAMPGWYSPTEIHGDDRNGSRRKLDRLRTGNKPSVLLPLVTKQVVAARKAVDVGAARHLTVKRSLGRRRLLVGALVTVAIFWVKKAFVAYRALVRPLRATQMGLLMTSGGD
jgi:hypothetical protein